MHVAASGQLIPAFWLRPGVAPLTMINHGVNDEYQLHHQVK